MPRNRFPGKKCVLCPNPSYGVGEHVWPSWLIRDLADEGPFTTDESGQPYLRRDKTVATSQALPSVHVPMCNVCNGRLNAHIEEPAKSVVRKVLLGSASHTWPTLTPAEAKALSRWFLKVGLLLSHPDAEDDNPHSQAGRAAARAITFHDEWTNWLSNGTEAPGQFTVYAQRRSITSESEWTGVNARLLLPSEVTVDGKEHHFMTRAFGIRGLDATIVWHPGWPIQHPLVDAGRAVVLWPNPTAVDLSTLHEVHPSEFAFATGGGRITCTQADYGLIATLPLQVGLLPVLAAHQVGATSAISTA